MKKRSDFVTNSSSSSFILGFKDEGDYAEFYNRCADFDYMDLFNLIDGWNKDPDSKPDLEDMKMFIYRYFYRNYVEDELLKDYADELSGLGCSERYNKTRQILESDEFKKKANGMVKENEDYLEAMRRFNSCTTFVKGTIWDTDGGLLEWAIRNGILESEFSRWCIVNWNVG